MELKLKGVNSRCKLRAFGALFLASLLAGCPTRPLPPAPPVLAPVPPPGVPRVGRPYDIVAEQSLLIVLVYRGGALASAGHNHVIASHTLGGTVYVPGEAIASSFEVHVPVAALTVDEPELRAQQNRADFPPEVAQSARDGTRRNMLGSAVLDADQYPEVVLRAQRLEPAAPPAEGALVAQVEVQIRGERRSISLPVHYQLAADTLTVTGETPLRQSDLGLTPFSAFMGALAVQDEMRVSLRLVARAAAP
jgi:polyisoprenoid-binding protein YceI